LIAGKYIFYLLSPPHTSPILSLFHAIDHRIINPNQR
jgi:hypothetical protein